ncbi:hypothetical protein JOC47_001245 [Halanaerobacter jeridensis]|uniref:Uncharacterized protein n=2 Tax=Halanaerobacter jeridensis TaxID=706427 RepID=A0A939BP20_9FIRM|nr:hypothetical protein [Halanaerobacter jeridensis]
MIFRVAIGIMGSHNKEAVRAKIKDYLYEKYGEEFVVDRIGQRRRRGDVFYQARIYPEAIIGTNKWWDDYYYASASVAKKSFGRLGGVGDSYSYVMMNKTGEEYLLPKVKDIFGDRVRLKVDSEIEIWGREDVIVKEYRKRDPSSDGTDSFIGYKESDFKKAKERVVNDPEKNRLFLDLDVYIFDRIEDDNEKEKRRKDIFEFVQYLKEEGLFEYLEMRIVFVDERVLANSYDEFEREVNSSHKVRKYIEEENTMVELPPEDLRKEMSRKLEKEIDGMSEEELLANMEGIRKDELNYDDLRKWNSQYQCLIYSIGILEEKYPTSLEQNPDVAREYEKFKDVGIGPNLEYVYIE